MSRSSMAVARVKLLTETATLYGRVLVGKDLSCNIHTAQDIWQARYHIYFARLTLKRCLRHNPEERYICLSK